MRVNGKVFIVLLLCVLFIPLKAHGEQSPSKEEVLTALRRAAEFYVTRVANQGGYHATYTEDLSYGRSGKGGAGPTQVSATGAATPAVGLAFLEVWYCPFPSFLLFSAKGVLRASLSEIRDTLHDIRHLRYNSRDKFTLSARVYPEYIEGKEDTTYAIQYTTYELEGGNCGFLPEWVELGRD